MKRVYFFVFSVYLFACGNDKQLKKQFLKITNDSIQNLLVKDALLRNGNEKPLNQKIKSSERYKTITIILNYSNYCVRYNYVSSLPILLEQFDSCIHNEEGKLLGLYHYRRSLSSKTRKYGFQLIESQTAKYNSGGMMIYLDCVSDRPIDGKRPDFVEKSFYEDTVLVRREITYDGGDATLETINYDNLRRRKTKITFFYEDYAIKKLKKSPFEKIEYEYDNKGNQIIRRYGFNRKRNDYGLETTEIEKHSSTNKTVSCNCDW